MQQDNKSKYNQNMNISNVVHQIQSNKLKNHNHIQIIPVNNRNHIENFQIHSENMNSIN